MFIWYALAAMKTSWPNSVLSPLSISTSCGLNKEAALSSSTAHSPALLRWANSAGTQPRGPVPVTSTLLAPNSYSLCNFHTILAWGPFAIISFNWIWGTWLDAKGQIIIIFFLCFFRLCKSAFHNKQIPSHFANGVIHRLWHKQTNYLNNDKNRIGHSFYILIFLLLFF